MASWDVSRHPEWDLMYAAGLTSSEIAEACHSHHSTVREHLRTRETYEPGTRAKHQAALSARPGHWASSTWHDRFAEARIYLSDYACLPEPSSTGTAKSLYGWISEQRRELKRGTLSTEKAAALAVLGDWTELPHQKAKDDHWRLRLDQLSEFTGAHDRMPRWAHHDSEHERILGVWLHAQTQGRGERKLAQWRLQALDAAFPHGWHSRM
ncbi:helicase associated domain-containing protein [Arthrobacter cryoconiti]|uniref:Helicase associated domain-containing protein n=1 Tax=Arthrobacter cryoconiti TaxID=748907 RepID=A0ABV8QXU6_9MICC|nr:helicase associated domain-containing protein [Arthrobacter cryoconiti]MCC9068779.1 helicase associated domain-containing protein [Arthrobacter cryoconiti]